MKFEIGGISFVLVNLAELVGETAVFGRDLLQKLREFGLGKIAGWEHGEVFLGHSAELPAEWQEGKKFLFWEAGFVKLQFYSREDMAYSYAIRSEGRWMMEYSGMGFWGLKNISLVTIEGPPRSVCEKVLHCPTLPNMRDAQLVGFDAAKPGVRDLLGLRA